MLFNNGKKISILKNQITIGINFTTYKCPPEFQGYNPDYLPYDTGWWLQQPYEGIFAEDLSTKPEFILTGIPPGCCPCPPCPDCAGGVWTPVLYIIGGFSMNITILRGKQWGMVGYRCPILGHEDVICSTNYDCTLYGLLADVEIWQK